MKITRKHNTTATVGVEDMGSAIDRLPKVTDKPVLKRKGDLGDSRPKRTSTRDEFVRVQLDFSQAKIDELTRVMKEAGLDTRKDLFNNALSIFAWAIAERQRGRSIVSVDENSETFKELVMHPLETAAANARIKQNQRMDDI